MAISITFNQNALKRLHTELKTEIINAAESSTELRSEISKVFQQANRRIQNIEKSGVFSPAVEALGEMAKTGKFTKFSMAQDWESLKSDYAKCVSFLNQPTSTATGAKQYIQQIAKSEGVDVETATEYAQQIFDDYYSAGGGDFASSFRYEEFKQELHEAVVQAKSEMEVEAVATENALQTSINTSAAAAAQSAVDIITSGLKI